LCQFFFSNRQVIHHRFRKFFEIQDEDNDDTTEGVEDTPKIRPKEATARFYFTLTFQLAGEDITKLKQIENMSVYLVLNAASLLKDKRIQEMNELKKLEQKPKYV
jgi:hypothetical protein